ncbi:hypothetical protein Tsubulata_038658 [Turnera subulata]|uniref:Uncharacterized protein n=1 Tax=Turnera subulata TaxID=218843 RepID=A0A9Q0G4M8_9ROSI|nr:hypothetical protein Tsubulata_038658 [Turnera subulata]
MSFKHDTRSRKVLRTRLLNRAHCYFSPSPQAHCLFNEAPASSSSIIRRVIRRNRRHYRGGRSQFRRSYSDRPYSGGGSGQEQFVTGDSHFRSVRDANLGYRRGGAVANRGFSPRYNQNQQFRQPPPPPQQQTVHRYQNQNQQFRHPPPQQQPFGRYQNQHQQFRQGRLFDQNQNQAVRPRQSKPLDYRSWEYAKTPPPPNAEKFKLLHEEAIEFNKHGLRDNVAQICVLESMGQNKAANKCALPSRGEIKLGQVTIP